jgi:hypothetical protein
MDFDPESSRDGSLRPGDFARLLLAAAGLPPRQRARDQQADRIGEGLRRVVLDRVAAMDPEPDDLEAALARIIVEVGEPSGPTRGVCNLFRQEWDAVDRNPRAWEWLLAEALSAGSPDPTRRRRRGSEPTA